MSLIPVFSPYQSPIVFSLTDTEELSDGIVDTLSFTALSIGAAASNRYVFGSLIMNGGDENISSITVGGVTAQIHINNDIDAKEYVALVFSALVPTGTTADVVVTFSSIVDSFVVAAISLYRVVNLSSSTAFDSDSADAINDVASMSLNVPSGGFIIAAVGTGAGGFVTTVGVTEDNDVADLGCMGSASGLNAETGRTVSFDGGIEADLAAVCASFR